MNKSSFCMKILSIVCVTLFLALTPALAQEAEGSSATENVVIPESNPINVDELERIVPVPTQFGFMPAASSRMERIISFHDDLMIWILGGIVAVVLGLLLYVSFRYRKKKNPTPSSTTHNVLIEIIWTAIPVLILIVIALPSFKMLYYLERVEDPEMTVKVTGYQWYWGYEYMDHGNFSFLSYMIPDDEIDYSKGQKRLLSTDNPVVLPIDTNIRFLITAADVIHSFTVPPFGFKKDAVPGRLSETWVKIDKPGVYYGQCSEICGTGHAFMPIEIHAVTKEEFEQWVLFAQEEFAFYDGEYGLNGPISIAYNNLQLEGVR
ncbi:MAG: cytochrome c oxidase subunit II [Pseudomonadota bacterium]